MVSARWIDRAGPHAALIFGAAGFGGYFVLTKASLSGGVDPFVFGTYRDGIGFLTLFLYASCFERQWFFVEWKEQKTHCLINCTARSGRHRIYEPQPVFDLGSNLGEGELSSRKLVIMFYFHQLLSKKHPMGQIWTAATVRLSINRKKAAKINIEQICHFNIGAFMEKDCPWPTLFRLVQSGELDPTIVITHVLGQGDASDAYTHFNAKEEEWIKVLLKPEIDPDVITTEGPGLKKRARNLVSGAVAETINTVQKATGAVTSATSGTSTDVQKA